MSATSNPQTATEQARKNYRDVTTQLGLLGLSTAIPEGVRALAEKTLAQTRQVYDRSSDAFNASVATFEKSFDAAGQGAAAFNARSSTSSGVTSMRASTWPRVSQAPRISLTWWSCKRPFGATSSVY